MYHLLTESKVKRTVKKINKGKVNSPNVAINKQTRWTYHTPSEGVTGTSKWNRK